MNQTYELDDDEIITLHQPVDNSTPENNENSPLSPGCKRKSTFSSDDRFRNRSKRVAFALNLSDLQDPNTDHAVSSKQELAKSRLTPRRVPVKGSVNRERKSRIIETPVKLKLEWTKEELEKAGLTPRRVPVKGYINHERKSRTIETPVKLKLEWTKEELEKAGLTPKRVPVKGSINHVERKSRIVETPVKLKLEWTKEELEKAGLTPKRVPVKDSINHVERKSRTSEAPVKLNEERTKEELEKAGLTPRRVPVKESNVPKVTKSNYESPIKILAPRTKNSSLKSSDVVKPLNLDSPCESRSRSMFSSALTSTSISVGMQTLIDYDDDLPS